ncbi:spirocyclase AveC family protein [Mycobacterium sp.]|uniref:spirocyclase AveC family protein n=1 Tax=Mycobacterium sp. TaxID=1785 RepID=UPI003D14FF38
MAVIVTAIFAAFCHRGAGASIANPDPAGSYSEQGVPRPHPAMLGFQYWPQYFEIMSLISFVALIAVGTMLTFRRGRWAPILTMLAAALTLSLLDPVMNWSPYASYNPRLLHLPETWPWVRLAPTVEPIVSWLGYIYYWLVPAWALLWLYKKVVGRASVNSQSWVVRHPMVSLAIVAYPSCFLWDLMIETFLVRTGLIAYTQVIAPISLWAGQRWQYPIVMNSGFMALSIFMAASMMHRDDTGLTFPERTAAKLRACRRTPNLGTYLVTMSVMGPLFLTYLIGFGLARVAGVQDTPAQPWPYPETKVFDPQGFYRDHGEPGPFMVGSWTGFERDATRHRR